MRNHSPASERNKAPIFNKLKNILESAESVLEIGSGSGQHCLHATARFPKLHWQCTDTQQYLSALAENLTEFGTSTLPPPLQIDVSENDWLNGQVNKQYDIVFCANTLHIMSEKNIGDFFIGLDFVVHTSSQLIIYGPFRERGAYRSEGDAQFDLTLRARGTGSGIRNREWIDKLSLEKQFLPQERWELPANNLLLVYSRAPLQSRT